jgi:RHS repeat-associated protein
MRAIVMATLVVCSCGDALPAHHARQSTTPTLSVRYFHGGLAAGAALSTDGGGRLAWERRYEPYGAPIGAADLRDEPHSGLGKPVEAATGLGDHGARWQALATGRWLTVDPRVKSALPALARAPWELAPYAYAGGAPTLYWDPDGRDLRITGSRAKDLVDYLAAASGLDLALDASGNVSITGAHGGGSGLAAATVVWAVAGPFTSVHLQARRADPLMLVGRPAPGGSAGRYQIDVGDLDQLGAIDAPIAQAATVHELFEATLHSYDGRPEAHADQHARSIEVENAVLGQLGVSYRRGAERNDEVGDDEYEFAVDYGAFEVRVPYDSQGHDDFTASK